MTYFAAVLFYCSTILQQCWSSQVDVRFPDRVTCEAFLAEALRDTPRLDAAHSFCREFPAS